ncbi:hypothetical protein FSG60_022985 [Escherichia coli]|uniref:hypothetical protein n=1 Tax=Escherichia coli TaxID=562 RepID=UPI000BE39A07|nr:hypothetical protein [Escherichia coli]EEY1391361.1 hypothetical protein [Escherichia coli]EEY1441604.1 hypothetical protein [Escherichia coli]EFB2278773.1 hypothetical protein [Escherichia coli]EFC1534140.1 hypothetical protein [Escherichia coli]EFO1012494.1 hypothetical protein [Escherichia coli]
MSEKTGTKSTKTAKNSAAQENPSPLADVIVADGQANEPRPAEEPAAVQSDATVRLNVRATAQNGFWRCGRFWSHTGEDVEVTTAVAARLMAEPNLIVRKEE